MNKRYIDFVPSGQKTAVNETSATKKSGVKVPSARTTSGVRATSSAKVVGGAKAAAPYRALPQNNAGATRQRTSVGVRGRAQAGARAAARPTQSSRPVRSAQSARSAQSVQTPRMTQSARSAQPKPRAAVVTSSAVYESRTVQFAPSGLSIEDEPMLGVIENLNEKFVSKDVEKRPLSDGKPLPEKDLAKEAKSKRLLGRRHKNEVAKQPVENPVEKSAEKEVRKTYSVPKSPFINQENIVKRPLSRNVYTKKAEPSKEEHGPVTIISKPEKDNRIGIVVAVILIIILGAAAGTVAFLLLPK